MKTKIFAFLIAIAVTSINSHATPCGEFVYNKKGWLRHYNWAPNTASENTKKNGIASSTIKPSTENTTAAVDPGVSTGATLGSTQSWSSYGECSFWKAITKKGAFHEYLEENIDGIKKQAAIGSGGHIESIAVMSSCPVHASSRLGALMQKNYSNIYDMGIADAPRLGDYIEQLIKSDGELSSQCKSNFF